MGTTHNERMVFWEEMGETCIWVPISFYVYLKKSYTFHLMVSTYFSEDDVIWKHTDTCADLRAVRQDTH